MRTESLFGGKIRFALIDLIDKANDEIVVAMAWFTDGELYEALVRALRRGVKLKLLTQDENINREAMFDVANLVDVGMAEVWLWDFGAFGLMHHKFIVVDGNRVVTGSYNWTYKAAKYNKENVMCLTAETGNKEDMDTIEGFLIEFDELVKMSFRVGVKESETTQKVEVEAGGSGMVVGIGIESLRKSIKALRVLLIEYESERSDVERVVGAFELALQKRLGVLIVRRMELEAEIDQRIAEKSMRRSDKEAAEEKRREYERAAANFIENKKRVERQLGNDEDDLIKRLFRETMQVIHPDKWSGDEKCMERATELSKQLIKAYKEQDLERVKELCERVKNDPYLGTDVETVNELEVLEKMKRELETKINKLAAEIEKMKKEDKYKMALRPNDWESYFDECDEELKRRIQQLEEVLNSIK